MTTFTKDPNAALDYIFDWSQYLEDGDTIASATVTVPTGLTLDGQVATTTSVTAWLSGGSAGRDYRVTCSITTVAGRTDERSILLRVRQQ